MKHSEITDPKKRGRFSSQVVGDTFRSRPWTVTVWETKQYSAADSVGYDMFVRCLPGFLDPLHLDGEQEMISVQIKSDPKRAGGFVKQYAFEGRFFNVKTRMHQFILCGMDEGELILADIVGQMVAHARLAKITESEVLSYLEKHDSEAVACYKRLKVTLIFRWYGHKLPSL